MKILVSGLLNIETTVAVKEFPINYYPIDYPFFGVNSGVGGVGYNIAKALFVLGDTVELYSFLGNDPEAERIEKALGVIGFDTSHIEKKLKNTPASVVLYDPSGRRRIYCDLKDIQEQSLSVDTPLSCDIAALCNINFNRELIKKAKSEGILTATDVHVLSDVDDEYNRDFMENADILFLSDEEIPMAHELFIRRLYERYHNQVIVIGMGDQGAMLCDNGKVNHLKVVPCKNIVNTVGAGDALFSAFLHFYAKDKDALSSLKKAQIFASKKIAYSGASKGFCTEDEVEQDFSHIHVNIVKK
ncbi:MAG: carbohydrate kinase family protein [Ruminococcus sp.]|nr:carbohydrate kinase family protein [Ruminococcus sp.]